MNSTQRPSIAQQGLAANVSTGVPPADHSLATVTLAGDGMWHSPDGLLSVAVIASPSCVAAALGSRATHDRIAERTAKRYAGGQSDWPVDPERPIAAVIIDRAAGHVEAAIDPGGIHQLYFAMADDRLLIATRLPTLVSMRASPTSLRIQSLYDYVYFSAIPSPQTVYENIQKLPAGHRLRWSQIGSNVERYFNVRFETTPRQTVEDLERTLRERLACAVDLATTSQSTTGAFLSGGLDSSTVAGLLAHRTRPTPAQTFSIGFSAEGYDEIEYARIAVRHFGTVSNEYYVTPDDVLSYVREIAPSADEPFGNSSVVPAYVCARLARNRDVPRLLAGDGGDELFAGNSRYAKQLVFSRYQSLPSLFRTGLLEPTLLSPHVGRLLPFRKVASYVRQAKIPLPDRLQSYNYLHRHSPGTVFCDTFLQRVDTHAPLQQIRDEYSVHSYADSIDRMLFLDWKFTLHDNDLVKVNTACRLAGIDVAYPMLDPSLMRFSCQIPGPLKMYRGRLRWFYKHAFRDFLPEPIINKKKHGFGLPFGVWMKTEPRLRELSRQALASMSARGVFREDFLNELMRLHEQEAAAYYGELVWTLTTLELWLQAHAPQFAV